MPIKVTIQALGLNINASLKDEALVELIRMTQEYRNTEETSSIASGTTTPPTAAVEISTNSEVPTETGGIVSGESEAKRKMSAMSTGELLNALNWTTYPEKILLLAAWSEARGLPTPWKKEDIESAFLQAKERPPGNFSREVSYAIKQGWVHTETPRTYLVTRTGWNRLASALK